MTGMAQLQDVERGLKRGAVAAACAPELVIDAHDDVAALGAGLLGATDLFIHRRNSGRRGQLPDNRGSSLKILIHVKPCRLTRRLAELGVWCHNCLSVPELDVNKLTFLAVVIA